LTNYPKYLAYPVVYYKKSIIAGRGRTPITVSRFEWRGLSKKE